MIPGRRVCSICWRDFTATFQMQDFCLHHYDHLLTWTRSHAQLSNARPCERCKTLFIPHSSNQIFCTPRCKRRYKGIPPAADEDI